jgi:hypothetical protein
VRRVLAVLVHSDSVLFIKVVRRNVLPRVAVCIKLQLRGWGVTEGVGADRGGWGQRGGAHTILRVARAYKISTPGQLQQAVLSQRQCSNTVLQSWEWCVRI